MQDVRDRDFYPGLLFERHWLQTVGNDCCVGVYHGRQTLVQDLKEEVLTFKLRSLKHFLGNGRCVNYIAHVCLGLYCMIRYMLQIEPTVDDCCVLSYQTDS